MTQLAADRDYRLTDIVRRPARPDAAAISLGARTLTYAELALRSNRTAHALRSAGLGAGDRLAYLDTNAPEFFELLFGAAKIGAVLAPVNWRLTPAEMTLIVRDSGSPLLMHGPGFAAAAAEVAAGIDDLRLLDVSREYEPWLSGLPDTDTGYEGAADEVVLQLYTSGTTGLPKGVMLSHRNFSALQRASASWDLRPDDVSLVAMPLFHVGGAGWALVGLQAGVHNVCVATLDPVAVLHLMQRERVTHSFLVPAALSFLAAVPGAAALDWSALRALVYGASPITTEALGTVLTTFRAPMYQVYGMTETTGAITQLDPADHDPGGPRAGLLRSAGRPYDWVQLRIADPVTGTALPPDGVGEVLVRSSQVTQGYWRRPDETARSLDADGWLHSGDAGYLDADGYLFLTDRLKDMIVTGGENVYPIDVEQVLAAHPGVADVAVIGVPDERWGEAVKAVVVARPGHSLDPVEVVSWSRTRLAGYKQPRTVDIVAALPRNPTGKVLKKDLRAPYWAGRDRGIS